MKNNTPHYLNSVSELHSFLNIKSPAHPLVSVINFDEVNIACTDDIQTVVYNFYTISIKKNFDGKIKYGQQYYDFNNGIMTFFAPKQRVVIETNSPSKVGGWMLVVHPDFLQGLPLIKRIKDYGFFSYATNEALHLSDDEEVLISAIMQNMKREIEKMIDLYTQDVVVSHIDLLLNYSNRFYSRQFITRKKVSNDLLLRFEDLLTSYFQNDNVRVSALPTVHFFAEKLSVSVHYLNDMLTNFTGQTTQQHIQNKLLEKAKELLSTSSLSVSEIAYELGFEHPQSLNKLFKNKTNQTPLAYRESFN